MKLIKNAEFGGERPLFESHDLRLENVIIRTGESAIKECSNIEAVDAALRVTIPSGMYTVSKSTVAISMSEAFGIVVFRSPEDDRHDYRRTEDVP